jgi:hypothetical protein
MVMYNAKKNMKFIFNENLKIPKDNY